RSSPIGRAAKDWPSGMREGTDVDMVWIGKAKAFWAIPPFFTMDIDDFEAYAKQCTHVWTHSYFQEYSRRCFKLFTGAVLVIRDPRDAFISQRRHFFEGFYGRH